MKLSHMLAAAGLVVATLGTAANAYPGDGYHRDHRGDWRHHRHCWIERHHHRDVRVCR